MPNPSITQLDPIQAVKRCYSEASDAIRTIPAEATSFQIEVSADDGDSVIAVPKVVSGSADITSASTGTIIAEQGCVGIKSVAIYSKTTATITGPQTCVVQVSPADAGDVWINTAASVTPSANSGEVSVSGPVSIVARRIRVVMDVAITSGTASIYLVGQST